MIKQKHYQVGSVRVKIKTFEERMRELARRERIRGEVDVFQWDPKAYSRPEEVPESNKIYLVKRARNTLVRNFAIMIYNLVLATKEPFIDYSGNSVTPQTYYSVSIDYNEAYEGVRLGTDTTTQTEYSTYKLASELDIDADARTVGYVDNAIIFTSTWNAGKVTQQIGEIGLVGYVYDGNTRHKTLFGRLASADNAFDPFTPDPSLNLTVNYRITW